MDLKDLLKNLKEDIDGIKKVTDKERSNMASDMVSMIAENVLLKLADRTARSTVLSMVMSNGGSFKITKREDYKDSEYKVIIEPGKDDSVTLKAIKKDSDLN